MRKTVDIVITAEGRDKGKCFKITEMSADAAEWWAVRFLLALGKHGIDIGDDPMTNGMGALATRAGFDALFKLDPMDVKPLLKEMLDCVEIYPDPGNKAVVRALIGQGDIEEVMTLWKLRLDVFELNTGFSIPASLDHIEHGLIGGLAEYRNVPGVIGAVVSCRLATLHELQTVYSLRDAYDFLEIIAVDAHNRRIIDKINAKMNKQG